MESFSFLDILAVAIIAVSVVSATLKGFAIEILSLAGVVAGFFLAAYFYTQGARLLMVLGIRPPFSEFLGFVGIFIAVLIVAAIGKLIVDRTLKVLQLKWIDRLLGSLFGLLRGCLIVAVIFLALTAFPVRKKLLLESRLAEYFITGMKVAVSLTPAAFRQQFDRGYDQLYQLWLKDTLKGKSSS